MALEGRMSRVGPIAINSVFTATRSLRDKVGLFYFFDLLFALASFLVYYSWCPISSSPDLPKKIHNSRDINEEDFGTRRPLDKELYFGGGRVDKPSLLSPGEVPRRQRHGQLPCTEISA